MKNLKFRHLLAGGVLGLALSFNAIYAQANDQANVSVLKATQKIDRNGVRLPYTVLRSDMLDGLKPNQNMEVRNGGFGSAMTAHPTVANQFYALTDRGPNAKYSTKAYGKGKIFPTPDYTPRIGLFELQQDGSVKLVKTILLRRPDGTRITGLPNSSALGGTGETPYHNDGSPILKNGEKPFNNDASSPDYNPIRKDDYGLDGEGLVAVSDGTFWVSDEYGPHMVHFDSEGKEIERINAFRADKRCKVNLPAEFANRRPNRGMEGLAITPDEKTLVGIMQSTMRNPNKSVQKLDATRIVTIDPQTGAVSQFLYKQEKTANSNSEIVAVSPTKFLVIERDGKFLNKDAKAQKHVYLIDLSTGTDLEKVSGNGLKQDEKLGLLINGMTVEQAVQKGGWEMLEAAGIKPVSKKLVVDMVKEVGYPHDKMEGLWLINETTLGVLNDDDFASWSTKGKLHQKMLNDTMIDGNTLYIVDIKLD
ncbi:esterase-like activity of phytase family protein [Maridesulfovibrio sp.]|uniref:esterase-like activity of phytase family protein n=1 Tax=Maridesulfovibrio sp. TaxID=2795000 RepID=UPI0029CA7261|nr:esterase-like activity of phytase family protein [Maridesulfovibrio sp.]